MKEANPAKMISREGMGITLRSPIGQTPALSLKPAVAFVNGCLHRRPKKNSWVSPMTRYAALPSLTLLSQNHLPDAPDKDKDAHESPKDKK
jgi:hypothetical protein